MDGYKQYAAFCVTVSGDRRWELCSATSARNAVEYIVSMEDIEAVLECYQLVDDWKRK